MSTRSPARSAPNTSPATTPPRKAPPMNEHPISDDERARRQKAIDFARTTIELSGFALSPGMAALGVRFVAGELSESEYKSGRASWRARGLQDVLISVVAVSVKKNKNNQ